MIGPGVMMIRMVRFCSVLALFCALGAGLCHADCSTLYGLAQRHANDMARRNSLDHAGFMKHRGRQAWMKSPHHRANMMLGGCQAIASAVSKKGRRYWVMEIGGGDTGSAGRDLSVDSGIAP